MLPAELKQIDNALGYTRGPTFVRDVFLAIALSAAGTAFLEVRRLHNPGEIRRFLLGRYRVPVEEERVFLFVDLKDSTSLAETLGPKKYSRFLGACYRDLAEPILAWRGEVCRDSRGRASGSASPARASRKRCFASTRITLTPMCCAKVAIIPQV